MSKQSAVNRLETMIEFASGQAALNFGYPAPDLRAFFAYRHALDILKEEVPDDQ